MEQVFLDLLSFLSPEGYYARNPKEKQIFRKLELDKKVSRKAGTRSTYILTQQDPKSGETLISQNQFLQILKPAFSKLRSNYKPFVSLGEIRTQIKNNITLPDSLFKNYLLNLYKDGKNFYYILDIF